MRDGVQVIPFDLNDGLSEFGDQRLKKSLRCEWVKVAGVPVSFVQEPWESGLTVFLPAPLQRGATSIAISVAGESILRPGSADIQGAGYWGTNKFEDVFYPLSTTGWYPTHGFLQRSTFDLVFLHRDSHRAISIGDPYEVKGTPDKGEKRPAGRWMCRWHSPVSRSAASTERSGRGNSNPHRGVQRSYQFRHLEGKLHADRAEQ